MLHSILSHICLISICLGNFFLFAGMVGFVRYSDFYIKLHAVSMFNTYGINFILFAIAVNTYDPVIFFEMMLVIITNILATLCVIHCFARNAILNNIKYEAKSREDVIKEKTALLREQMINEELNKIKKEEKKKNKALKKEDKKKEKERKKQEKLKLKEEKKLEKEREKEMRKEKKEQEKLEKENKKKLEAETKNKENNTKTTTSGATETTAKSGTLPTSTDKPETKQENKPAENSKPSKKDEDEDYDDDDLTEEEKKIKAENEELKKKIKEQKRILRKKIETARKKAFTTRKPEEIEKTEKMINEILTKHNLTEDMLKDDDDDE